MVRPIRDPSMRGQEEYAFVHALVRDVAYGQIARDDRAEMHQAAATWIEAVSGERGVDVAELLAYHLGEAMELTTDPDADLRARAYRALMQAGERARGLNPTQGSTYYAKAVGAADDDLDRARALMRAGEIGQIDVEQSERRVQEAHDLFAAAGDLEGQAEALVVMAGWAWWRGDTERAMEQNDEAVRLLEDRPDSEAKAAALVSNVSKLFIRGLDAEAVAAADAAAPVVNSAGSAEDQIKLLSTRGAAYANAGYGEEGLDDMATAMGIADDRNFTFQSGHDPQQPGDDDPPDAIAPGRGADHRRGHRVGRGAGPPDVQPSGCVSPSPRSSSGPGTGMKSIALAAEVIRADDERGGSQAGGGARSHIGFIEHYQGVDNPTVDWARPRRQRQGGPGPAGAGPGDRHRGDHGTRRRRNDAEALLLADEYNDTAIDIYRTWFLPWVTGPWLNSAMSSGSGPFSKDLRWSGATPRWERRVPRDIW